MDGYYTLRYKSSPENVAYVLHKEGNKLNNLTSPLSPKKLGLKLEANGEISAPKYFYPPKKIDKITALQEISKKMDSKIERVVNAL